MLGITEAKSLNQENGDLKIVFVATIMCNSCFIFLGFYWMIVYWWSQVTKSQSKTITFGILTTLWLVLGLYLVGTTSSLGTALYFEREEFITNGFHKAGNLSQVHLTSSPVLTLSSIVFIWIVYVIIFVINIIFTYCSN